MAQWLYANDGTSPIGLLLSAGSTLSDGSAGDTSTGPTEASATVVGSPACGGDYTAQAVQQAVWDGLGINDITAISVTGKARVANENPVGQCTDPDSESSTVFTGTSLVQISDTGNGADWETIDSRSVTINSFVTINLSGTWSARFVRRVLTSTHQRTEQSGTFYAFSQNTDLRVTATAAAGCPLPNADQNLPRGTRKNLTVGGSEAPDTDEWEIYRCDGSNLVLIDSGLLGLPGLDGWEVASADGNTFDIYAPPGADIADDYEARIDESGLFYSINFNVIATAEQNTMAERPFVFEGTRYGKQGTANQPVVAGRKSQMLGLAPPTPMEPSTTIQTPGNRAPTELIAQKGHTEAPLSGPMGFADLVEMLASLFGHPVIKTPGGATLTRDIIFQPPIARDETYSVFTFETGTEDFPARFHDASLVSATLSMGKTENTIEAQVIGKRILESLAAFTDSSPDLVPLLPVAPKDNAYYMGTIWWGLGTVEELCETQNFSFTVGARRVPHFTQCDDDADSWDVMLPTSEDMLASLSMSHKSRSRAYLANLRDKTQLYFKWLNTGPTIEGAFRYEAELIFPTKFQGTTRGESDSVTAGIHELKPNYDPIFNPYSLATLGGYVALRLRVKSTDYDFSNATPV